MEQEKKDFPILVFMITYVSILCMYLVTYRQGSPLLWAFFIIERLLSYAYEQEVDEYFTSIEASKLYGMNTMVLIVFAVFTVVIFLYAAFKAPRLFVILILGEMIDFIFKKLKEKLKRR